jgi:hypothetical protein
MTRSALLRAATAAALAFLLLTPPAAFAQGRSSAVQEDHGGWLASIWTFLADFLLGGETLDNRCGIDPDGCPGTGANLLDNRCTIDPNGGCQPGF